MNLVAEKFVLRFRHGAKCRNTFHLSKKKNGVSKDMQNAITFQQKFDYKIIGFMQCGAYKCSGQCTKVKPIYGIRYEYKHIIRSKIKKKALL